MTIDVHGHITSPRLFERFPMPASLGDIEGMIEGKLAVGIDLTIVGSPVGAGTMVPMPGLDNYAQPADELDAFHEWAAETIRANAEHLRGYVYVNPLGGRDELDRAAKWLSEPEFVGLIVNTSVNGEYLDSPAADDFFAMASSAGAPVLLHPPAQPVESRALRGHLGLIEHVARPCDITCGVAAILFAGWLEKYPGLRLIAPNAGGALALLAEKLELAQRRVGPPGHRRRPVSAATRPAAAGPPGPGRHAGAPVPATPIRELLSRIYVDTATPSRLALAAAIEVFGSDHLMFGTDSPPMTSSLQDALDRVEQAPLSADQRRAVLSNNATTLFGLTDDDASQGRSPEERSEFSDERSREEPNRHERSREEPNRHERSREEPNRDSLGWPARRHWWSAATAASAPRFAENSPGTAPRCWWPDGRLTRRVSWRPI